MVALVGFVVVCLFWLTFLEVRRRNQKRKIEEYRVTDQENIIKIRELVNEVEYLKMLLYGKKDSEKSKEGDETYEEG